MTASLYQRVSCFSHSSINDRSRQAVPGAQMFPSAEFSPAYYRYLCNGLPGGAAARTSSGQGQAVKFNSNVRRGVDEPLLRRIWCPSLISRGCRLGFHLLKQTVEWPGG